MEVLVVEGRREAGSTAYIRAHIARAARCGDTFALRTIIIPRAAHDAFGGHVVLALERRLSRLRTAFSYAGSEQDRQDEREDHANEHEVQVSHECGVRIRVFMPTGDFTGQGRTTFKYGRPKKKSPVDRHHPVIILLVLLLALALFGVARNTERIESLERIVQDEYRVQSELFNQNQELVRANLEMRESLIELSQNLSSLESASQACFDRLGGAPRAVPQSRIDFQDLDIDRNAVLIQAADVTPALIGPTGSMRPILDEGTIVLELPVMKPEELYPGDIIIYELNRTRIIHRIVALGYDTTGWYAIAKGDNNPEPDPEKIRFAQIRGVVGGIIY